MESKVCEQCGEKYFRTKTDSLARWNSRKFCSLCCSHISYGESIKGRFPPQFEPFKYGKDNPPPPRKKIIGRWVKCAFCGEGIYVTPSHEAKTKTCSRECRKAYAEQRRQSRPARRRPSRKRQPMCWYVMPPNGRGYALDVAGDYQYKPEGSPWCLSELPVKLGWEGYYWAYVDGRATLIHGQPNLRKPWVAARWMKMRRMWTYLVASSRVRCEGVGFSFGGPAEFCGWLCMEPIYVRNTISKGEMLARLAWQLDSLRPGAFMRLVGGWKDHRHMVARICGQKN